jgi:hypothetical protein
MTDPTQTPELDSIRTIEFMYDARSAMNSGATSNEPTNGVTSYVSTTIAPPGGLQQAVPTGMTDDVVFHAGGRSSAWVWISGIVVLLLAGGELLRRKMVSQTSSDA